MHPKAIDKIGKKVEGSLKNCRIDNGWPVYQSIARHVDSLAEDVLKLRKDWLTSSDVFSIFYDLVFQKVKQEDPPIGTTDKTVWDVLGEEKAQQLKKEVVDFFLSVPRNYEVYIPIPNVTIDLPSVELNIGGLALVAYENADDIPGGRYCAGGLLGLMSTKLEPKKVFLRYSTTGYCSYDLENKTIRKVFSVFKIIFQQGIAKGLFHIKKNKPAGLISALMHYQVPKAHIVCIDKTSATLRSVNVELPLDTCNILNNIDINLSHPQLGNPIREVDIPEAIRGFLKLPALLVENYEPEAVRVKSAIEWCFNSYATENSTMSFLQTCIGLEALLGEGTDSGFITQTLADRCAYLIGTEIKGRKNIRENFKKLYDIRSKLVHGGATELGEDEQNFLSWGRSILEYAIFKEIKHLNMDKPN